MNIKPSDTGERPAGTPGFCYYCNQPAGQHLDTCVCVEKTVVIRATIDYIVSVPRSWDQQAVENQRNLSGWCADNDLDAIADYFSKHDGKCACPHMTFEMLRDATEDDHKSILELTAP